MFESHADMAEEIARALWLDVEVWSPVLVELPTRELKYLRNHVRACPTDKIPAARDGLGRLLAARAKQ